MMIENRYQICTYSDDIGSDDGMDYPTIGEAMKHIKEYLKREQAVFIYDRVKESIRHAWNRSPVGIFTTWVDVRHCIMHRARSGWKDCRI